MHHKVFAIYDSKSESYGMPIFLRSSAEAIRTFVDAATKNDSLLGSHPADFTLFEIGVYSQATAQFVSLDTPRSLGVLLELIGPS